MHNIELKVTSVIGRRFQIIYLGLGPYGSFAH
jgi:hypothetical protein